MGPNTSMNSLYISKAVQAVLIQDGTKHCREFLHIAMGVQAVVVDYITKQFNEFRRHFNGCANCSCYFNVILSFSCFLMLLCDLRFVCVFYC